MAEELALKVGKLCGEVAASKDAHTECRARFDKRLDDLHGKIDGLSREFVTFRHRMFFIAGAASMLGATGGSFIPKILAAMIP